MTNATPNDEFPVQTSPSPLFKQFALQAAATILVLSLAWPYFGLHHRNLPWPETALGIGSIAWVLARLTHQPKLVASDSCRLCPVNWAVSLLDIDPAWFLNGTCFTLFRGAAHGQIPLYLTNVTTTEALINLLKSSPDARFVDLGAGIGSTIKPICRALPLIKATGIEKQRLQLADRLVAYPWISTYQLAHSPSVAGLAG